MFKPPKWNRIAVRAIRLCTAAFVPLVFLQSTVCGQFSQEPSVCSHCQSAGHCVHRLQDSPAFEAKYGNPYRLMDCQKGECQSTPLERWKRSMQASHWGYPEYFQSNTFGSSNRNAFTANIRDGAIERATLYKLDFYPEDSPQARQLTPKGLERLEKSLCVSQAYGCGLRFEQSTSKELTQQRREWIAELPEVIAAGVTIQDIRPVGRVAGVFASEGIRRYQIGVSGGLGSGSSTGSAGGGATGGVPLFQSNGPSAGNPSPR